MTKQSKIILIVIILIVFGILVLSGGVYYYKIQKSKNFIGGNTYNPASAYCLNQGASLEKGKGENGGEISVCVFPGGTKCESWDYYSKCNCPPEKRNKTIDCAPRSSWNFNCNFPCGK